MLSGEDGMGMEKQSRGSTVLDCRPQMHDREERTCDWNRSCTKLLL